MDPDFKLLIKAWLWLGWMLTIAVVVAKFGIGPAIDITTQPEPRPMPDCQRGEILAENMTTGALICIGPDDGYTITRNP